MRKYHLYICYNGFILNIGSDWLGKHMMMRSLPFRRHKYP